jgi:hypothetical protein
VIGKSGGDAYLPARKRCGPIAGATGDCIDEAASIRADEARECLSVGIHRFADTVGANSISCLHCTSSATAPTEGELDTTLAVMHLTATFGIGLPIENTN